MSRPIEKEVISGTAVQKKPSIRLYEFEDRQIDIAEKKAGIQNLVCSGNYLNSQKGYHKKINRRQRCY